jgi:hypothetical protein
MKDLLAIIKKNLLININMERFYNVVDNMNQSKYLAGVAMILLNLGSKYITLDISESQEEFMSNTIFRRVVIFTLCFFATRDVIVSLTLTAAFVILVGNVFNENSKYSIIKKPFREISKNEYLKAIKIKELYELQQLNNKNNKNES